MPSTPPPMPVEIGQLVANKYRIERVLGQGGMGIVVAAMHEQLGQRVAIKLLLPEAKTSPNALARFAREARSAATIRGEHVARVLDVGELEGGAPYIVMEYLEGRDLAETLAEAKRLTPDEAVGYVLQACEAIAEAHGAGIVHRDLKPSNLFLTKRPDGSPLVKVLDFGISKALLSAGGEGDITTTSSFVGSPVYSPPEQLVRARDVDGRADIWSLGTILFEALAGRPPFVGESVMHVASKIFNETPTPLAELRPELPPELCEAVMRCLRKRPEDRFPDVRALAGALAPFAPAASVSAERVARIVAASTPPEDGAFAETVRTLSVPASQAPRRRRGLAIVVGGVLGACVLAAVVLARQGSDAPARPAAGLPSAIAATREPPPAGPSAVLTPASPANAAEAAAPSSSAAASAPAPSPRPPTPPAAPRKNPLSVDVK